MSQQYTCNYCQSIHSGNEALQEHIYNTPSCLSIHNTRRGSRRQRDVERRQRNQSRNDTEAPQPEPPSPVLPREDEEFDYTNFEDVEIPEDVNREGHPEGEDDLAQKKEPACVICMTNVVKIVSRDCGHLCCCIGCSKRLYQRHDNCPKCRGPWDELLRVYL